MKNMKDYFKSEADYLSYMLIYGSGEARTNALRIHELLYGDKKAAKEWAEWILANTDGEEATNKEIARIYKRMTGEELFQEETEEATEEETEEATEEPKTFKVGGTIKCTTSTWLNQPGKYYTATVTKRTKCYIYFSGHDCRRKIKTDANGNEYIEWEDHSNMGGTRRWVPA